MFTRIDAFKKLITLERMGLIDQKQLKALELGLKSKDLKMCNYTVARIAAM